MNKKIKITLISSITLLSLAIVPAMHVQAKLAQAEDKTYRVEFYENYLRESFTLSTGFKGIGNNLLYKTVEVNEGSLVSKPTDPTRQYYSFKGWFKEEACQNAWNFSSDTVTSNVRLFASWGAAEGSQITEPTYTPPSTVLEESAAEDYVIDSIMNFKISLNILKLPRAGITKLTAMKDNVLPLMEYKVKASKNISATFDPDTMKLTVTCADNEPLVITVKDDSTTYEIKTNDTYETKAKNYEKNAAIEESYHVMLAGSSSMEFWETYKEDMDPIVTYNHGIGGTTIQDWTNKLNQRLVYPYKPKMVVYYVGINNVINSGEASSDIIAELTGADGLFEKTHEALPNTKIQYVLMNLIPNYTQHFNTIRTVNTAVEAYQATHSEWLTLINPGEALLKDVEGVKTPNAAYFRTDGLHLSYYGYIVWGGIIKESILRGLENM